MASPPRRIWITRAQPGAAASAQRIAALGHAPIVLPLLAVRPLTAALPPLDRYGALAFTSANGVRAFAALSAERRLPVFTVGEATAQAARDIGFTQVRSADGDVVALADLLAAQAGALDGPVLHPGASEPAGDLPGALAPRGVIVEQAPLYETIATDISEADLAEIETWDAVLLHSPKAARLLARRLAGRPAPRLRALCISPAAALPLTEMSLAETPVGPRQIAAAPTEAALLALIGQAAP